jgi:hypothetical protein
MMRYTATWGTYSGGQYHRVKSPKKFNKLSTLRKAIKKTRVEMTAPSRYFMNVRIVKVKK